VYFKDLEDFTIELLSRKCSQKEIEKFFEAEVKKQTN